MRGARGRVLQPVRDRGIIPRGCGEHLMARLAMLSSVGSSPRMRGAPLLGTAGPLPGGIIPADAGSTDGAVWQCGRVRDHPRGCGEHRSSHAEVKVCLGSSPRMRGALRQVSGSSPRMRGAHNCGHHGFMPAGIIPADAGSTSTATSPSTRRGDHPRGCGEHSTQDGTGATRGGSSPRLRGAHAHGFPHLPLTGTFPADAGSTDDRTPGG